MRKRTFVAVGYYGMRNLGDDLFVATLAQLAPPDVRLLICAPPIDGVEARYLVPPVLAEIYRASGRAGAALRLAVGVLGAFLADVAILGGGSVLQDVRGVRRAQASVTKLRRTPWRGVGVSVGPFEDHEGRARVINFLTSFEALFVRDTKSAERAANDCGHGAVETRADLAASFALPRVDASRGAVAYIPCANAGRSENASLVAALASAAMASSEPMTIRVLSVNSHEDHGDNALASEAAEVLRGHGVPTEVHFYSETGLTNMCRLIGSSEAVISGRMHGALVAEMYGRPAAVLEYHEKITQALAALDSSEIVGLSREVTDWTSTIAQVIRRHNKAPACRDPHRSPPNIKTLDVYPAASRESKS